MKTISYGNKIAPWSDAFAHYQCTSLDDDDDAVADKSNGSNNFQFIRVYQQQRLHLKVRLMAKYLFESHFYSNVNGLAATVSFSLCVCVYSRLRLEMK